MALGVGEERIEARLHCPISYSAQIGLDDLSGIVASQRRHAMPTIDGSGLRWGR